MHHASGQFLSVVQHTPPARPSVMSFSKWALVKCSPENEDIAEDAGQAVCCGGNCEWLPVCCQINFGSMSFGCWSPPIACFCNSEDDNGRIEQCWCGAPPLLFPYRFGQAWGLKQQDGSVVWENYWGGVLGCCCDRDRSQCLPCGAWRGRAVYKKDETTEK